MNVVRAQFGPSAPHPANRVAGTNVVCNDQSSPVLDRGAHQLRSTAVYGSWEELAPLRDIWNALARQSSVSEIFLTYDWLRSWTLSQSRPIRLAVIVAFKAGAPIGFAPLMLATRRIVGVPLRTLEFLGTPHSDYSDFVYDDEAAVPMLWSAAMDIAGTVDLLHLQQIKQTSATCCFLRSCGHLRLRPCVVGLSSTLPSQTDADIRSYLKGPGLRPRSLRRIEKEGRVGLVMYDCPAGIKTNLPTLFTQHIRRWANTNTPSFFRYDQIRQLYMNWADHLEGNIVLAVLTLDERPVASLFAFAYNRKLIVYTLAFDPAYRRFHCGLVCIVKVMQCLRNRGIEVIDFSRGTERFKSFFADVPTLSYEAVWPRTTRARILWNLFMKAKDMAFAHPSLKQLVSRFGFAPSGVDAQSMCTLLGGRATTGEVVR